MFANWKWFHYVILGIVVLFALFGFGYFVGTPEWHAGAWFEKNTVAETAITEEIVEDTIEDPAPVEEAVVEEIVTEATKEATVVPEMPIFKLASLNQVSGYSIVAVYSDDDCPDCLGVRYNTEVSKEFLQNLYSDVPVEIFSLELDWEIEFYPSITEAELRKVTSLNGIADLGIFNDDVLIFNINPKSMDNDFFDSLNASKLMAVFVPREINGDWCSSTEFVPENDLDRGGEYYTLYIDVTGESRWNPCLCK